MDSEGDGETHHETNPTRPKMVTSSHGGHRRSLSGSILARLPFLRPSFEELPVSKLSPNEEEQPSTQNVSPTRAGGESMAAAVRQHSKTRRRRGSLRKTAILGTRERRSSAMDQQHYAMHKEGYFARAGAQPAGESNAAQYARRLLDSDNDPTPTKADFDQGWRLAKAQELALDTDSNASSSQPSHQDMSPIVSPTSGPYASTTDDDEGLTFSRPTNANLPASQFFQAATPATSSLLRRRSTVKASPLTHAPPAPLAPAEWDYSETEWWGWFVLVVTWIVFVVGMGSCLGVWSWAWDVGETPYAPPELEDDPTLPIVGYYPALIVLTAVLSWAWCLVAWVGMKYFRHAKVVGDDE